MPTGLCAHFILSDMSQIIVLLTFGNGSGLNKIQTFISFVTICSYYIKVAFLLCILQCATRSKVQNWYIIQNRKNTICSL